MFSFVYLLPLESVSNLFYWSLQPLLKRASLLLGWKPSYINSPDLPYLYFKFPLNFHLSLSPFILKTEVSFLLSKQNYPLPISPTFHRNIAPYRKPLWGQWLVSSSLYPPVSVSIFWRWNYSALEQFQIINWSNMTRMFKYVTTIWGYKLLQI